MILIKSENTQKLSEEASISQRKRKNFNYHQVPEDRLQRMLNAFEPGTYVRPHKHENPDKREVFILLTGRALIVEFDKSGAITGHVVLDREKGSFGVEISPGVYHTIVSLEKGTVLYEIKDGPYFVANDKDFAEWAPPEGGQGAEKYLLDLLQTTGESVQ